MHVTLNFVCMAARLLLLQDWLLLFTVDIIYFSLHTTFIIFAILLFISWQQLLTLYLIHIRQSQWDNATLPFHNFLHAHISVLLQTFFCTSFIWVPSLWSVFPIFFKHSTSSDHAESMKSHMHPTFKALLASIISRSIGTTLKEWSLFHGHIHICHGSPISEGHTCSYRSTSCGSS